MPPGYGLSVDQILVVLMGSRRAAQGQGYKVFPPLVSLYNTELKLVCTVAGKNVTEAAVDDAADSCDLAPVRDATPHARTSRPLARGVR